MLALRPGRKIIGSEAPAALQERWTRKAGRRSGRTLASKRRSRGVWRSRRDGEND